MNTAGVPLPKSASPPGDGTTEKELKVSLEDRELWGKFQAATNEMIVTKTGRRMFPVLKLRISGLDPNAMYSVLVDFIQVDKNRWKYVNGDWIPGGKAESTTPTCTYTHPDSPNFGAHWMRQPVSFDKIKLTNKLNGTGQIMLHSLHKYEPRIHIIKVGHRAQKRTISTFSFSETQFIAVTAYQNEEITALKIKYNPFAKAFQDVKDVVRSDISDTQDAGGVVTSLAQITGSWLVPSSVSSVLPSFKPPARAMDMHLFGAIEDRMTSLRAQRHAPYKNPYQRRASPHGNLPSPVDVQANIPLLNLPDTWPASLTHAPTPCFPRAQGLATPQPSYPMWSMGNLSQHPQYLRSTQGYQVFQSPTLDMTNTLPFRTNLALRPDSDPYQLRTNTAVRADMPATNCNAVATNSNAEQQRPHLWETLHIPPAPI